MEEAFISIRLSADVKRQLREFAKKTDRSIAAVIRIAVLDFLERHKG